MRLHSTSSFTFLLSELNRKVVFLASNSCSLTNFYHLYPLLGGMFCCIQCALRDCFFFSFLILFLFFLLVICHICTEGVREFSCTDSGCIGQQVTLKDSLLHSMAEKKERKKQNTGTQGAIFWKQGFKMQLINLLFLLTLVVKLVKSSHLKMQRMAHQNFW